MHVKANHEGRRYRVIQWCTGNVGARSLATILAHPRLELVGLFVTNPAKAGKDAAELLPPAPPTPQQAAPPAHAPTGVRATTSAAEMIALEADCVVYMPHELDLDHFCALLASGKNIATTISSLVHPDVAGADVRARIEAACARGGGTSVFTTGSSPGVLTQQLPLALLSAQSQLRCVNVYETANLSTRDSHELMFGLMGFGKEPPSASSSSSSDPLATVGGLLRATTEGPAQGSFAVLAQALGVRLDGALALEGAYALARRDVEIAAGTVRAGTVAAMRVTARGERAGRTVLRYRATWFVTTDVVDTAGADGGEAGWDFGDGGRAGIHVQVDGDAPFSLRLSFPDMSDAEYAVYTPHLSANPVVNAVPAVCEARAGMLTLLDLPPIVPAVEGGSK